MIWKTHVITIMGKHCGLQHCEIFYNDVVYNLTLPYVARLPHFYIMGYTLIDYEFISYITIINKTMCFVRGFNFVYG